MKTFQKGAFILLFLSLFSSAQVFCQQSSQIDANTGIQLMEKRIQQKKVFTTDDMLDLQMESKQMMKEDRISFYEKYSISGGMIAGSLGLNLLVPGTGSLLMGDYGGGFSLIGISVLGGGLFLYGLSKSYFIQDVLNVDMFFFAGIAIYGAAEIIGWILPFTYASEWNRGLRTGLNLARGWPNNDNRMFSLNNLTPNHAMVRNIIDVQLIQYRF